MFKKVIPFVLGLVLFGCSHTPSPVPLPHDLVFKGDGWELTTPPVFSKMEDPDLVLALENRDARVRVMLAKDEFAQDIDTFTFGVLSMLQSSGQHTLLAIKVKPIGQFDSSYVEILTPHGVRVFEWLLTTGTHAYILGCGGPDASYSDVLVLCRSVEKTWKITESKVSANPTDPTPPTPKPSIIPLINE